jgi:hypothetical protein
LCIGWTNKRLNTPTVAIDLQTAQRFEIFQWHLCYRRLPYRRLPYRRLPYRRLPYRRLPYRRLPYRRLPSVFSSKTPNRLTHNNYPAT